MTIASQSIWGRATRRIRGLIATLMLAMLTSAAGAAADPAGTITSHGYAVFGELKYGPDFTHLEYTNPQAPKGGIYRFAGSQGFDSLNQYALIGNFPWIMLYIFDPLMERSLDEPASYYGVIAKTITYPKDLSWVEFEMNPAARWHDGRPITVDDVLFSLEVMNSPLINPRYGAAARVTAKAYRTGPNRVRMELTQKNNPTLPAVVAGMKILPKHYYETRDLTKASLERPVTSGPYKIGTIVPGRRIDITRDKNYWGADLPMRRGRFNFDTVSHLFYRDFTMAIEAFGSGLLDLKYEGSARRWAAEKQSPAFISGDIQRNSISYENGAFHSSMVLNTRRPFLSDRRVRRAIQMAYDFEYVRDVILRGGHGRTASFFANTDFEAAGLPSAGELKLLTPYRSSLPPEIFTEELTLPVGRTRVNQRSNLKHARDLLAQAGYRIKDMALIDPKTGKPVTLDMITYSPLNIIHAGYFIQNMKRLGIEVNFRSFDTAQFRHLSGSWQFDLMINVPAFPPLDAPGVELRAPWSSQAADTPNMLNFAGIKEPAIDNAIETIVNATDRQTVIDGMHVIDRVARANFYVIPFQHTYPAPVGEIPITYWNKFGRPEKDPTYNFPFMAMDHWWWDPAKEAKLSHGVYR